MSISFSQMNAAWRASAASANDRLFNDTTASKLFTKGNPSASSVPSVLTPKDPYEVIDGFGQAFLNSSMTAAILAAQAGADRVQKATVAASNHSTTKPIGDFSNQVTHSGALAVDFGADGPAAGGGYRFLSGADLKAAFKVAFGAKTSNGEKIDKVSVFGDTLTGSTSGADAHDVFTLTLHRDSGLYTFKLVGPIDQKTTKGSYNSIFLRGLMQATSSTGKKVGLPTIEIDIYNDYGAATSKKNWGILHEGALTYKDPSTVVLPSAETETTTKSKTYVVPTDPRTFRGYTTSPSAGLGVINSVNIFS